MSEKNSISKTIHADHLVCIECGAKVKMLKTHLRSKHKLSFATYTAKHALPSNYPAVPHNTLERYRAAGKLKKQAKRAQTARRPAMLLVRLALRSDAPPIHKLLAELAVYGVIEEASLGGPGLTAPVIL